MSEAVNPSVVSERTMAGLEPARALAHTEDEPPSVPIP